MKSRLFAFGLIAFVLQSALAAPVSDDLAKQAVTTWIGRGAQLNAQMGRRVSAAWSCSTNGASFHVVKLAGGGFVVTSADTEIEPIIAFSESEDLVVSDKNPLWSMLTKDLASRAHRPKKAVSGGAGAVTSEAAAKWADLTSDATVIPSAKYATGKTSLSDVRVPPLVQSKWNQEDVGDDWCYNYYTPEHYPCGCVATAGAQIMRYHGYPVESVTPVSNECDVQSGLKKVPGGYQVVFTTKTLTMIGGVYAWADMPLVPTYNATSVQRQAIGKLTSDLGIACLMYYTESGSGAGGYMLSYAMKDVFGYVNAVPYQYDDDCGVAVWKPAFLSNLNAGLPVAVGVSGDVGGHAIIADGYGYSGSTLYVHFNLGWGGSGDAWYAPPVIDDFSIIDGFVCNIYPTGEAGGVICSGRVLSESGEPIAGATVSVDGSFGARTSCQSDTNGIYALILEAGDHTITAAYGEKSSSTPVTLKSNSGVTVYGDGFYMPSSSQRVGNLYDQNITLSKYYTVTFNSNGGSAVADLKCEPGRIYKLPSSVLNGQSFAGWVCSENKKRYDPELLVYDLAEAGGSVTMTAIWK